MTKNPSGRSLIKEIQDEFTRMYPFLKIEFPELSVSKWYKTAEDARTGAAALREEAISILQKQVRLSDSMKTRELEAAMEELFGTPVQVFRRSGKFWIGTRMTREWNLRQQNALGSDLAAGI